MKSINWKALWLLGFQSLRSRLCRRRGVEVVVVICGRWHLSTGIAQRIRVVALEEEEGEMEGMSQKHNTAWHVWNGLFAAWMKHGCQKERKIFKRGMPVSHVYSLPVTWGILSQSTPLHSLPFNLGTSCVSARIPHLLPVVVVDWC